jgi:hypothetical protein
VGRVITDTTDGRVTTDTTEGPDDDFELAGAFLGASDRSWRK